MNLVSRFFHSPINAFTDAVESVRRAFSKDKAADCVFIIGPGNEQDVEDLSWKAFKEGLNAVVIGDGRHSVTMDMIETAKEEGIIGRHTEVICVMHGGLMQTKENKALRHVMHIGYEKNNDGEKSNKLVSTTEVIRCIRSPAKKMTINSRLQSNGGEISILGLAMLVL